MSLYSKSSTRMALVLWVSLWMLMVPWVHVHPEVEHNHGDPGHLHHAVTHTVFSDPHPSAPLVRMGWEVVMLMLNDPMMDFSRRTHRIDVDDRIGQIVQVMEELVSHVLRDRMPSSHGEL